MKLNGEPKELEMHQKDVETMQEKRAMRNGGRRKVKVKTHGLC